MVQGARSYEKTFYTYQCECECGIKTHRKQTLWKWCNRHYKTCPHPNGYEETVFQAEMVAQQLMGKSGKGYKYYITDVTEDHLATNISNN